MVISLTYYGLFKKGEWSKKKKTVRVQQCKNKFAVWHFLFTQIRDVFCKDKYISFCLLSWNKIYFLQKNEVPYVSSILIN